MGKQTITLLVLAAITFAALFLGISMLRLADFLSGAVITLYLTTDDQ